MVTNMNCIKTFLFLVTFLFSRLALSASPPCFPVTKNLYDQYTWAYTYYYGITASDALSRIIRLEFHRWPEHIQSLEVARTLSEDNFLRRLVHPLVYVVQFAVNGTYRVGSEEHNIAEIDPYFAFRWTHFPWDQYVNTSFAIGEGISYTSSIPALEKKANENTKRLLNYLMFEASFAIPKYPRLQLITRIHHRSGAYGLYRAGNTGSNDVGLGVRYLVD